MRKNLFASALLLCCSLSCVRLAAAEPQWRSIGPDGGDARSFAFDPAAPSHLYLGTTNSWIYQSSDGGSSWTRLARLNAAGDLIIDHLLVDRRDPHTLYAGAWKLDGNGGGVYVSHDDGANWVELSGMDGQSVRALAEAPSQPQTLVAGTLTGVYRSQDGGAHWREISPDGSGEIREVESIAIDPTDPNTVYAGTWHLPWKTSDGGARWSNIKRGVIDDSDVFSIIIDRSRPSVIYASACSGIYRSNDGGELFRKVQGIPSTARRTRVLMQDPDNRNIVYAGTTEGLYKTTDGGVSWTRTTSPDVTVNDIYIDPRNPRHVLLATDRGGVLASEDGGLGFQASNTGFSERQVAALLVDQSDPSRMYAGVVNDKNFGGVFVSNDRGLTWEQRSAGLDGKDVFALAQAGNGTVVAGTNAGIYRWRSSMWEPDGKVINHRYLTSYGLRRGRKVRHTVTVDLPGGTIEGRVNYISATGDTWFAATSQGVYRSENEGATWEGPVLSSPDYLYVGAQGADVIAARREDLVMSSDRGRMWRPLPRPEGLSAIQAVAVGPEGMLWAGGREGLFFSRDQGNSWEAVKRLPINGINGLHWDAAMQRMIVSSKYSTVVYAIDPGTQTWKWWDTGWDVHAVCSVGSQLIAASLTNGVVLQPAQASSQTVAQVTSRRRGPVVPGRR
jgi:photosystem II stability/assembly factor-like uncharacterized protein